MADVFLTYQKKRKEFGRCPTDVFEDVETQLVGKVQQDVAMKSNYTPKDPNTVILTNIPDYSIHSVSLSSIPQFPIPNAEASLGEYRQSGYIKQRDATRRRRLARGCGLHRAPGRKKAPKKNRQRKRLLPKRG